MRIVIPSLAGRACDILMNEVGLDFRATKDIDMILLIEERFTEFASAFWSYIKGGGYKCGWKSSDAPHFYRFTEPQEVGYPVMIELFSRRPDFQIDHPELHLTPLPVSDEISSLAVTILKAADPKMPVKLSTEVDNIKAQRLYTSIGFVKSEELDGDDLVFIL